MNDALPEEFISQLRDLEESYLSVSDPIRQSGFNGGAERWRRERGVILEAVDGDGDFLDIGCANGYLLECLVEWAQKRRISLTPYGVDIGPRLIELAKQRLPQHAENFWVANAWDWRPPRKFRYVYTLYDCVPAGFLRAYVGRLLERYVAKNGTLIIGAYGSKSRNQPARDVGDDLRGLGFELAGSASVGPVPVARVAWLRG